MALHSDQIQDAIEKRVDGFIDTHSQGTAIGKTGLSIEIKKSENDFTFQLRQGNNEIVLRSQMYRSYVSACKGLGSVLLNGGVKSAYKVSRTTSNGTTSPSFTFSIEGVSVLSGNTYATEADAERGRASVQRVVRKILEALVVDKEPQQSSSEQSAASNPKAGSAGETTLQPAPAQPR